MRAEKLGLSSEGLLGLRIEGWILNQTVNKGPEVLLDLRKLNVKVFVLLVDDIEEVRAYLIGNMVHV